MDWRGGREGEKEGGGGEGVEGKEREWRGASEET